MDLSISSIAALLPHLIVLLLPVCSCGPVVPVYVEFFIDCITILPRRVSKLRWNHLECFKRYELCEYQQETVKNKPKVKPSFYLFQVFIKPSRSIYLSLTEQKRTIKRNPLHIIKK